MPLAKVQGSCTRWKLWLDCFHFSTRSVGNRYDIRDCFTKPMPLVNITYDKYAWFVHKSELWILHLLMTIQLIVNKSNMYEEWYVIYTAHLRIGSAGQAYSYRQLQRLVRRSLVLGINRLLRLSCSRASFFWTPGGFHTSFDSPLTSLVVCILHSPPCSGYLLIWSKAWRCEASLYFDLLLIRTVPLAFVAAVEFRLPCAKGCPTLISFVASRCLRQLACKLRFVAFVCWAGDKLSLPAIWLMLVLVVVGRSTSALRLKTRFAGLRRFCFKIAIGFAVPVVVVVVRAPQPRAHCHFVDQVRWPLISVTPCPFQDFASIVGSFQCIFVFKSRTDGSRDRSSQARTLLHFILLFVIAHRALPKFSDSQKYSLFLSSFVLYTDRSCTVRGTLF